MIEVYQDYLVEILKQAGIKTKIHTSMKSLEVTQERHVGAVLAESCEFEHSGSKRVYYNAEDKKKKRVRRFKRNTTLSVVIGDTSVGKCDAILVEFMKKVKRGINDGNGNFVEIEVGKAEWVHDKDSILKAQIAVQLPVIFHGGIYRDTDYALVDVEVEGKYVEDEDN